MPLSACCNLTGADTERLQNEADGERSDVLNRNKRMGDTTTVKVTVDAALILVCAEVATRDVTRFVTGRIKRVHTRPRHVMQRAA